MGGIPPRPSVPPERSGGGHWGFSAKWVLTFSNKHHPIEHDKGHFSGGDEKKAEARATIALKILCFGLTIQATHAEKSAEFPPSP